MSRLFPALYGKFPEERQVNVQAKCGHVDTAELRVGMVRLHVGSSAHYVGVLEVLLPTFFLDVQVARLYDETFLLCRKYFRAKSHNV